MTSALPFDDFRTLLRDLPERDERPVEQLRARLQALGAPACGLGDLSAAAEWMMGAAGRLPAVQRPLVALFAGTHGLARHGIDARPMDATALDVEHCAAGGAAVSQICGANDLGLKVFDLALDVPTGDITEQAAFDERGCAATMAFGMEAVAGGFDLMALGALGIGGEVAAGAVLTALFGGDPENWLSQPDAELRARQAQVVARALEFHGKGNLRDPFEVLRRVGGREIAGIAGAILAARTEKIPVLLEGAAGIAAAALLHSGNPRAIDHCRFASTSGSTVQANALQRLGLTTLVDAKIAQPGVAVALGVLLARSAAQVISGMKPLPQPLRH